MSNETADAELPNSPYHSMPSMVTNSSDSSGGRKGKTSSSYRQIPNGSPVVSPSGSKSPPPTSTATQTNSTGTVDGGAEETAITPTIGPTSSLQERILCINDRLQAYRDFTSCFTMDYMEDDVFRQASTNDRRNHLGKIIRHSTETTSRMDHKTIVTALYLSIFAILGALLRIILAQLFGEECKNPGTVGWLAAGQPFCITAQGVTRAGAGIIFADLPANMLGSFFMGLMQTATALGLTARVPVAFVPVSSIFQHWDVIHLAIRTGFCGSLTTFSSWNSEMIVLIYGTAAETTAINSLLHALFGYIIGLETAMGSYVFGKKIAVWLHRYHNPTLRREADDIAKLGGHVPLNKMLPGFERRYLAGVVSDDELSLHDFASVEALENWKQSTASVRVLGNPSLHKLETIERTIIVREENPSVELLQLADEHGWSIKSLWTWVRSNQYEFAEPPDMRKSKLFKLSTAILLFLVPVIPLFLATILQNADDAFSITYRTMWYSGLFAPAGALVRWKLSSLNGTMSGKLSWLPCGTLTANYLGCIVSILMIVSEVRLDGSSTFWVVGTCTAIKIGFAGCLTTVSSFVSEVDTLSKGFPRNNWDWHYIMLTLFGSCMLGGIMYGLATYHIAPELDEY